MLGAVGAAYVVVAGALWLGQSQLLYQPSLDRAAAPTPADIGLTYDDLRIETADGVRITGWSIPAPAADAPVVLFFHGNAGHIGDRLETLAMLHEAGAGVVIIDYRGYGASEGEPTESGTYADARAAWHWLTDTAGVAPARVVVFGRSLGAAVAAHLASETGPAGLVLEAAFTSLPDLAAERYPWLPARWLTRMRYATADYLRAVECPVMLAHAPDDEIVPFHHARRLNRLRPPVDTFHRLSKGGHNSAFVLSQPGYTRALRAFLQRVTRGGATQAPGRPGTAEPDDAGPAPG